MDATFVVLWNVSSTVLHTLFGYIACVMKLVWTYAIKCQIFKFYWSILKQFIQMLVTKRTFNRGDPDEEAVKRGNEYIDKLLKDISQDRVEEYDPYKIEDSVVGFNKKVVFVNVSGEAKLHDGYIVGLSTLHRSSDSSLREEGDRLRVKAELGAGELEFHYSGTVKFMNYGPTITVKGTLAYMEVLMEFTVDSETGKNGRLESFDIDDMRGMKVWITGLGPLNWAVNPIISGVTKIFKRFVRNFMENKVEKHIAERLPSFQFPIEGGGNTENPVTEETTSPETPTPEEPKETTPPETPTPEEPKETTPPETPATEEPEETSPPETPAPEEPEVTTPPETETLSPEEADSLAEEHENRPSDSESRNSSIQGSPFEESSSEHSSEESVSSREESQRDFIASVFLGDRAS